MLCVWSPVLGVVIYLGAEGAHASARARPGARSSSAFIPAHVVPALGRSSCTAAKLWLSPTRLRGLQLGEFTPHLPLPSPPPALPHLCSLAMQTRPSPPVDSALLGFKNSILSCFAPGVLVLASLAEVQQLSQTMKAPLDEIFGVA